MWFIVYILLALPIMLFVFLSCEWPKRNDAEQIEWSSGVPFLGNAHQMGKTPAEILNTFFEFWHKYNKDNFRIWIGYYANILVSNPKHLEVIMNSTTLIEKLDIYDMLHPWLGEGLLTSKGSKWHKHRKMITPTFHFNILQDFHQVMNENSAKFIKRLKEVSAGDNIIDFQDETHYLTLDAICDTAMGVTINAIEKRDTVDVVKAFKDMCHIINMRAFRPLQRSDFLYRFSPEYATYAKTLKTLKDFTNDIIAKRIKVHRTAAAKTNQEGSEFSRKKMLPDTLLSATIDGRPLNQQEIYEEVSTFMFEGHDTTTSGVAFAGYILSRFPEEQRKLYEEQQAVMGNELNRDATFQEISAMKYLDLFIKEAQRVYPSVPFIGRYTDKDYNIHGTIMPKGTTLNLGIIVLGYDDRVFEEPHRFYPERFEKQKPGPFEYVPFSAGPRNCIGQKFALLELKTVISKLVRTFEVLPAVDELVSKDGNLNTYVGLPKEEKERKERMGYKYDPILSAVLTLKSENGLHLRLR
uniref:Cytochrome P450 4e5, mitochondrial n=1 Tax=Drosophila mettleri TaxID=7228 RepID=CP4E5_DROMT|nr:RecName: Full=Cytochrome P450 4e5, mitochondrial; AltName: Full=CYPIVE5; Flags: Precursor [Drosophila mettleri]AAC27534.1 microsomal cytochrome P450 [Drosophila mettleri]